MSATDAAHVRSLATLSCRVSLNTTSGRDSRHMCSCRARVLGLSKHVLGIGNAPFSVPVSIMASN